MKKQLIILVPLALLILFFILNLVLGLSTPITGLTYEANGQYDSLTFHSDKTVSLGNEVAGTYVVADDTIHMGGNVLYKNGYSLEIVSIYGDQVHSYTCNTACAFQALLAIAEAVCAGIIISVFVLRIRKILHRLKAIEEKLGIKEE